MQFYGRDYVEVRAALERGTCREEPVAVRCACHALRRLILQDRTTRLTMIEDGMLLWLCKMVDSHVEADADLMIDCCRVLEKVVSLREPTEHDVQSKITESGFLPLLVRALQGHDNHEALLAHVCRLLIVMCFDVPNSPHNDNQDAIATCGLFQCVCTRLQDETLHENTSVVACQAVSALIYENRKNIARGVEELKLLPLAATVLRRHQSSSSVHEAATRMLFQVSSLYDAASDDIMDLRLIDTLLEFLESPREHSSVQLLWHIFKLFEIALRKQESMKVAFCQSHGPLIVIEAIEHVGSASTAPASHFACVYYIACILLSRVVCDDSTGDVVKARADNLMRARAPQFALRILKSTSAQPHVAEQVVRLIGLLAAIEENRVALLRLGIARQLKVVRTSASTNSEPGLVLLCDRATAALDAA